MGIVLVSCAGPRTADETRLAVPAFPPADRGPTRAHCATDVAALGDFAVQRLGTVHRWINNAGQVTRKRVLADLDAAEIADVVGVNVLGSLLCCRCGVCALPGALCTALAIRLCC